MSAYRIVVSKKTYSKTNVGDYVKVGKDDSDIQLYCKVLSKECRPSINIVTGKQIGRAHV